MTVKKITFFEEMCLLNPINHQSGGKILRYYCRRQPDPDFHCIQHGDPHTTHKVDFRREEYALKF